jgi:hypothetical protein
MANFNTDVAGKVGKLGAAGLTKPELYNGKIQWINATVTLPSTAAANDTITISQPLPIGATVVPDLCTAVCHADPGTALVIDIGDATDVDRYADGLNLNSGGVVNFCTPAIPDGVKNPLKVTTPAAIIATLMTATDVTNNSKITFRIALLVQD